MRSQTLSQASLSFDVNFWVFFSALSCFVVAETKIVGSIIMFNLGLSDPVFFLSFW
jgi:hypothetical protein